MSSAKMSQPISQLLKNAKYRHIDHTKRDILNANKYFKALTPRLERYTFTNGATKDLVCLDGTIPVTFRDASYNIPIGIFISDNHPYEAPICYVRPTRDMMVKTSRHVDGSGRVYLPYLSEWNQHTSDVLSLIQVMQIVFGQMCPVYQKTRDYDASSADVAMPPALPNSYQPHGTQASTNPVYPFSTQPQPPSNQPASSSTGTISDEHIKASLISDAEDKIKFRLREKMQEIQEEIDVLKKTSEDLNKGKQQLDEMKTRMAKEMEDLNNAQTQLQALDEQLQGFIVKYDKNDEEIDPDEVYGPTQPIYKQLLEAFVTENAVVDAIYYTGEGLRKGRIEMDAFLKTIRELSRRQFMLRAEMRACRIKASLPV